MAYIIHHVFGDHDNYDHDLSDHLNLLRSDRLFHKPGCSVKYKCTTQDQYLDRNSNSDGPKGVDTSALAYGGAAVGGLVFVIGIAIVMFRCTLNRRERERRNKEMAATLAENFDRGGGDPIASPRKGYLELGEGPPTPNPGHIGANLSRQGSQDAYFAGKDGNTGGAQGGYSPHYVQERYGAANAGNYGMYEETELSVIGGNIGRPTTPYVDPSVGYAPSNNAAAGHYAGYNDYERGRYDGYYGGGGGQATTPRAPQGYQ
ncbi:hypothetical protein BGX28_009214 [Mortierella sp. GBA30]|nr:hypothetical protein BGX28_009214 [Mortierella sp. GBA30]